MSVDVPTILLPRDPHHEFVRVMTHATVEKRTEDYDDALGLYLARGASRFEAETRAARAIRPYEIVGGDDNAMVDGGIDLALLPWGSRMAEINPGDIVRVATTPGFTDAAGTPTDPTIVRLKWRVAGGVETTWVFGTGAQVVKDSVGLYHADIPVVAAGLHYFRWEGTGAVTAAEESTFNVVTSFGGA